jgi:hypothetical protein
MLHKDQNYNDKKLRIAMVEILRNSLAIDRPTYRFFFLFKLYFEIIFAKI